MGLLLFILIVVLIATIGFWDTLAALLGAALVMILAIGVGAAVFIVGGWSLLNRKRGG